MMTSKQKSMKTVMPSVLFFLMIGMFSILATLGRQRNATATASVQASQTKQVDVRQEAMRAFQWILATHPDKESIAWLRERGHDGSVCINFNEEAHSGDLAAIHNAKQKDGGDCLLLNWPPSHLLDPRVPPEMKYQVLTHEITHLKQVLSGRYPRSILDPAPDTPDRARIGQALEYEAYKAECDFAKARAFKTTNFCTQYYADGPAILYAFVASLND